MENLIINLKHGSHAYGCATKDSDKDFFSIVWPDLRGVFLDEKAVYLRQESQIIYGVKIDQKTATLAKFCELVLKGDAVCTELPFCDEKAWDTTPSFDGSRFIKSMKNHIDPALKGHFHQFLRLVKQGFKTDWNKLSLPARKNARRNAYHGIRCMYICEQYYATGAMQFPFSKNICENLKEVKTFDLEDGRKFKEAQEFAKTLLPELSKEHKERNQKFNADKNVREERTEKLREAVYQSYYDHFVGDRNLF